ncbi:MAG: amidohydrolase family protein [Candidatus Marinimicrobia bacterium]|nr:amidohydrolase family protein [Candidatus Neomarinimicrobiota bacterium]MCF7827928.1 amidohydrolase family protein [Candidatus Neomarinimicrobiota bacterium]MCF7879317.1 amidohydrolase family protein [Candidatus Neomarinimicrobiota bacterium]
MVKIFSANWILPGNGNPPLQNHALVIREGKIFDIGPVSEIEGKYSNRVYDLGNTIIFPAFVNVHTHLELTHLRNRVTETSGFIPWMRQTSQELRESSEEEIRQGIQQGLQELHEAGTIGIGEVTSTNHSVDFIGETSMFARIFHEVQGFRNFKVPYQMQEIQKLMNRFDDTEKTTHHVAPHSPYLVGRKLFQEIEQRESLISLHLASLPEELEFFQSGQGIIKQMLLANEMYDYMWEVPETTPVRYFFDNYYYAQSNILVHMIHVSDEDMDYMAECHVDIHICLCPRSHKTLGLGLAPAQKYKKRGFNLCLGTDNIVSSGDYQMQNEMRAAQETYGLSPKDILSMATYQGAKALGFEEQIGSIEKGKYGYLLMMENPFAVDKDPYEALLESDKPITWLENLGEFESATA